MALGDGTAWDESNPTNNTNVSDGDDHILDVRKGVRIRLEYEHSTCGASSAGGKHKFLTLQDQVAAPTTDATQKTAIYAKVVSGKSELFYKDEDGTEIQLTSGGAINVSTASAYSAGHLYGGVISNNSGDATNDLDITACKCRDDADSANISVGAMTKRVDATWTAGTAGGGLDTGTIGAVACWVYIYAIENTTSTAPDFLFSKSASAPTMPAGYDVKRLIGARRWNGSAWTKFWASGNGAQRTVFLDAKVAVISGGSSGSFVDVDCSAACPTTAKRAIVDGYSDTGSGGSSIIYWRPNGSSDATGHLLVGSGSLTSPATTNGNWGYGQAHVHLDASQVFEYKITGRSCDISCGGFIEEL